MDNERSELTKIRGIGRILAEEIEGQGYRTIEELSRASVEMLEELYRIGPNNSRQIIREASSLVRKRRRYESYVKKMQYDKTISIAIQQASTSRGVKESNIEALAEAYRNPSEHNIEEAMVEAAMLPINSNTQPALILLVSAIDRHLSKNSGASNPNEMQKAENLMFVRDYYNRIVSRRYRRSTSPKRFSTNIYYESALKNRNLRIF